jgi:alkanesulfonate monooxygenase
LTTNETSLAGRPDMPGWVRFAQAAEACGIESVLMSFGNYEPDTLLSACALGRATEKLKFIAAYRLGLMQPTLFVQQINTLSNLIDGRIALNIIAGSSPAEQRGYGDFLAHDDRYARADEFLAICRAFWADAEPVDFEGQYYRVEGGRLHTPFTAPDRRMPELYVAGQSGGAEQLALIHGTCWMRIADIPDKLRPAAARAREYGVELGLRLCVICRPTRNEAIAAAEALRGDEATLRKVREFVHASDSQTLKQALALAEGPQWPHGCLWFGLVPSFGSSAVTLVGTPEDIVEILLEYREIGVTQFIVAGWPKLEEMRIFGREVLPRVRAAESARG